MASAPVNRTYRLDIGGVVSDGVKKWCIRELKPVDGCLFAVLQAGDEQFTLSLSAVLRMLQGASTGTRGGGLPPEATMQVGLDGPPKLAGEGQA